MNTVSDSTQTNNLKTVGTQTEQDTRAVKSNNCFFGGRFVCTISITSTAIAFLAGAIAEAGAATLVEELLPIDENDRISVRFGKRIIHTLGELSSATAGGFLAYHTSERFAQLFSKQEEKSTPEFEGIVNPAFIEDA